MLFILLFLSLGPSKAYSYFSYINTGEILVDEAYRVTLEPQIVPDGGGFNLVGHFDMAIAGDAELRMTIGSGNKTDFQAGGFIKWIPYPDYEDQPAFGFVAGGLYGRFASNTQVSLRFAPMASKKYEHTSGTWNTYVALPTGVTATKSETFNPLQIAFGADFKSRELRSVTWGGEVGINLQKSFNYISGFVTLVFDEKTGPQIR